MHTRAIAALSFVAITALSGCGVPNDAATRAQSSPLSFSAHQTDLALIDEQAYSLNRIAKDMVRKSTGQGAMIGAAVGCGLVLVSAKNAGKCLGGAAAGGVAGAVVGHQRGKRKVARSVAGVSTQEMFSILKETDQKLTEIDKSLPAILAKQDKQLAELKAQRAANTLSPEAYEQQVMQIHAARQRLAEALTNSANKTRISANNLGVASLKQPALLWHIGEAKRLEDQAVSTRSKITLF